MCFFQFLVLIFMILDEEMKSKDKDVIKYLNKIELIKEENSENF